MTDLSGLVASTSLLDVQLTILYLHTMKQRKRFHSLENCGLHISINGESPKDCSFMPRYIQ